MSQPWGCGGQCAQWGPDPWTGLGRCGFGPSPSPGIAGASDIQVLAWICSDFVLWKLHPKGPAGCQHAMCIPCVPMEKCDGSVSPAARMQHIQQAGMASFVLNVELGSLQCLRIAGPPPSSPWALCGLCPSPGEWAEQDSACATTMLSACRHWHPGLPTAGNATVLTPALPQSLNFTWLSVSLC